MRDSKVELVLPVKDAVRSDRKVLASLIGADYSAKSITPQRSDKAPNVVREAISRFSLWESNKGIDLSDYCVVDYGDANARNAATWEDAFAKIAEHAARVLSEDRFLISLGGDHSVSWPLIATAKQAALAKYGDNAKIGVIHLDVHHDVRELDKGPSNGTPMRGLIEAGTIDPRNLVQIGIHPFANQRSASEYCDEKGIRRFSIEDIKREGVEMTARRALGLVRDVDAVYLSVDIDVLDRAYAPGTVAAMPGGIDPHTLAAFVEAICINPRTMAMDIVEFDPERDVEKNTAYNAVYVLMTALVAVARRVSTTT